MNAIVLVKLPKIPLLANIKSPSGNFFFFASYWKCPRTNPSIRVPTVGKYNTIGAVNTSFCNFKVEGRQIYTINTIIRITTIAANTGSATGRVSSCLYHTAVYHDRIPGLLAADTEWDLTPPHTLFLTGIQSRENHCDPPPINLAPAPTLAKNRCRMTIQTALQPPLISRAHHALPPHIRSLHKAFQKITANAAYSSGL